MAAGEWGLAWKMARRELRGGFAGTRVFLACLALGVFALAAAGSIRFSVDAGLSGESRRLLGGDVTARTVYRTLSSQQRQALAEHGTTTQMYEMRAMARVGDKRSLVEIKAVDHAYPLYGEVRLSPPMPLSRALATREDGMAGVIGEKALMAKLGVEVGDAVQLGAATLVLTAVLEDEPDRLVSPLAFGPRMMMTLATLEATGLDRYGSLVYATTKLRIEDGTKAEAVTAALESRFPEAGWRLRTFSQGASGLDTVLGAVSLFLVCLGLSVLLIGGVGIGSAVSAFIEGKIAVIATLKTLGASNALTFRIYALQIGGLSAAAIVIGVVGGVAVSAALMPLLQRVLPVGPQFSLYLQPLFVAAAFGILTAAVFGTLPLSRIGDVPAAALFRLSASAEGSRPQGKFVSVIVLGVAGLVALVVGTSDRPPLAAVFVVAIFAALILFRVLAVAIRWGAGVPVLHGRPAARLALANLHRPGAPTVAATLSLGLSLSLLIMIGLVQGNLLHFIDGRMPQTAPAFFFIDIQPDQQESFERQIASVPEARLLRLADMVRGHVVAVKGLPVDENTVDPEVRWVVRGDRGLSTTAGGVDPATVVAGTLWPEDYQGPPLLSVAEDVARGLGVGVGDTVSFNILGTEVTGTIANLRRIEWASLAMNFSFILNAGTLKGAPRTFIATVSAPVLSEDAVEKAVVDELPNVSALRVRQVLESVVVILDAAGSAVVIATSVTIIVAFLVLVGAIASGRRRRIYDAAVLKVLGATRGMTLRVYALEYGILGLIVAVVAGAVGTVGAWGIIRLLMKLEWVFFPGIVFGIGFGALGVALIGGVWGTWQALTASTASVLRTE